MQLNINELERIVLTSSETCELKLCEVIRCTFDTRSLLQLILSDVIMVNPTDEKTHIKGQKLDNRRIPQV